MNRSSLLLSGIVYVCTVSLFLNSGCSLAPVSGGGTEGGNTICGVLINDDKSASVNARVYLLPSDYDPGTDDLNASALTATTNDEGNYIFEHASEGEYSIQAEDAENGKRSLITGVTVSGEDLDIPVDTLRNPGVMRIELPETAGSATGYVYVPGTTIYASFTDASEFVVVNNVPAKQLPPVCLVKQSDSAPDVLRYDVQVNPDDTAVVRNTQWKYARRLYLNTTAAGADVAGNVTNFPVVVRLTTSNFDFSQANTDGSDIRFIWTDSVPLAHEIERWDISAGQAEIWFRVDTVYGNNNTQFIMTYWGNPDAEDSVTNLTVFDTAAGFQGVWHLGENSDTLHDATPNRYHGIRYGTMNAVSCMVGIGQLFGDSGTYVDMGDVLNPGNESLTLSAWVKRNDTGLQTIMAKSDGGSPDSTYGWSFSLHTADQLHFFSASAAGYWGADGAFDFWSKEEMPVVDTVWHYVAAVVDRSGNGEYRCYLDGEDITGGASGSIARLGALENTVAFRIGAEANDDCWFTGMFDECIVAFSVRSEDWLRLCYINQGSDDRLVEFR
jgi:hypothetical protein